MDQRLRNAKNAYSKNNTDPEIAAAYIRALEQLMAIKTPVAKVQVTDKTIPCLLCEKQLEMADPPGDGPWVSVSQQNITPDGTPRTHIANPNDGISVSTNGNWGSRVLDGDIIYFFICDDCVCINSHKMFLRDIEGFLEPEKRDEIFNAKDVFDRHLVTSCFPGTGTVNQDQTAWVDTI